MDIKKRLGRKVIDAHGHIITVPTGTSDSYADSAFKQRCRAICASWLKLLQYQKKRKDAY